MATKSYKKFIEENVIDIDASRRGGTIKINVVELFPEIETENAIMGASQNYLGGGMAGSIGGGAMFMPEDLKDDKQRKVFHELIEQIKRYFHAVTNDMAEDWDEWGAGEFEQIQARSHSAY